MRVRIKFEPRDVWVGLYWTRSCVTPLVSDAEEYTFYVCLVPCLPIIISVMCGARVSAAVETPLPELEVAVRYEDHSDCDGEIPWQSCAAIADSLEKLLPRLEDEYYREKTQRFIDGLRRAATAQENVEFH